jgi:sulfatase modifying factor 1
VRRTLGALLGVFLGYALFGVQHERAPTSRVRARQPKPVPTRVPPVVPAPPAPPASSAPQAHAHDPRCPEGMAAVVGQYCTDVDYTCKTWIDPPDSPFARCGVYERPARCKGAREPMAFCMDRTEYTPPGETLPQNQASLLIGSRICKSLGKRLCTEREWNFACEGEEMRPYPYGFERVRVCNHDREDLYIEDPRKQVLADHRWQSGSHPDCVSPFGIFDMVGNVDEPVLKDPPGQLPFRTALKGGWWMPARNRCRPATTAHNDYFTGIQIGIRCCSDLGG